MNLGPSDPELGNVRLARDTKRVPTRDELVAALREIPTDRLRLLADWLDSTDRPGQPKEVQSDLRAWADHLDDLGGRL